MAKKSSKKSVKAPARKSKPTKKGGKGTPKKRDPLAPTNVSTGRGASPMEIGKSLVEMFNQGKMGEIEAKWWNPAKICSVEGVGVSMAWTGKKAVEAKNADWMKQNAIHGASAEGPFCGASGFAVRFKMDVENRGSGVRSVMEEVGVYTIENGKIVREEFMYLIG
jgi:hypothetical protein